MFSDEQLLRYNRQILLPQVDIAGQERLAESRAAVVGLGGLGCPAAQFLAAAGIGEILLFDDDVVELSNLQRQLAYQDPDIGRPKAEVMAESLGKLNPGLIVTAVAQRFRAVEHGNLLTGMDVVIDATDNLDSRRQINACCFSSGIPLVFAAAIRMEGQMTVFDPRNTKSPCFECVFGDVSLDESCSQSGILGSVVGTLGAMQATEAIKLLLDLGDSPVGRLLCYDAANADWQAIRLRVNPDCAVCGGRDTVSQDP